MIPRKFSIKEIQEETHDTFTLRLEQVDGATNFSFKPGQFNMLYAFGKGEVPISISGDPQDRNSVIHTIRRVGNVTSSLGSLKEGDCIGLRGPFGVHWPVEKAQGKDVVIVTGGIGLAPLRPVFYHVLQNREKYGRIALLYGARSPKDILYRQQLEEWRSRFDLQVRVIVDQSSDDWYGSIGVVTELIGKANFNPCNTIGFVCGPEIMMRFTIKELLKSGVGRENIYISMERNMKCGIGQCGHCQCGPKFVCKDGPVFNFKEVESLFVTAEI